MLHRAWHNNLFLEFCLLVYVALLPLRVSEREGSQCLIRAGVPKAGVSVKAYTLAGCPYCSLAMRLLGDHGVSVVDRELYDLSERET